MGVDFYACNNCGETFPDCGSYFHCDCGATFCSSECGKHEYKEYSDDDIDDENDYEEEISTCIYCRVESVLDHDLLIFILDKYGLTYDQACDLYKAQHKN